MPSAGMCWRRPARNGWWISAAQPIPPRGGSMSDPISLRNVSPELLHLAHTLSTQIGASVAAVFRLALSSGPLGEATKGGPDPPGTEAGLDGATLAKSTRGPPASALYLLVDY